MGIYNNDYLSSLISGWYGGTPMFNVDPLDLELQRKLFDFVKGIVPNSQRNLTPENRLQTGNNNFSITPPGLDFSNLPPYRGTQDLGGQGWVPGTGVSLSGVIPSDAFFGGGGGAGGTGGTSVSPPQPTLPSIVTPKPPTPEPTPFGEARSRADVNMLADMIMKRLLGVQPYANKEKPLPQLGAYSFLGQGRY